MENNIQTIKELYAKKKYKEVIDMSVELINSGSDQREAFMYAAKAFLFSMNTPMNESHNDTFVNTVGNACSFAKTIEEVHEIERDIFTAYNDWHRKTAKYQLALLEGNPNLEQWQKYFPQQVEYIKTVIFTQIRTRNCDVVNAFCEEKGLEKGEYAEKYAPEIENEVSSEEIKTLEYETALRIFEKTKAKLEANANGNGEFVKELCRVVLNSLLTTECIISSALPEKEKFPEEYHERLLAKAEVVDYYLRAMVYPNGNAMSLYLGDRAKDVDKLRTYYAELAEYNPDFVAPPLPNVEPVKPPQANSGGGCYVATAVYGSYDCPEVWTLRRFRDYTLAETWYGRAFIRTYYAISPTLVKWFGNTNWFKNMWKPTLDKMVARLNGTGVESTPYNDRTW